MNTAIARALQLDHSAILLVGDPGYYGRFGFRNCQTSSLSLPGTSDPERLLGLELVGSALEGARGLIAATGRLAPSKTGGRRLLAPHARCHSPWGQELALGREARKLHPEWKLGWQ